MDLGPFWRPIGPDKWEHVPPQYTTVILGEPQQEQVAPQPAAQAPVPQPAPATPEVQTPEVQTPEVSPQRVGMWESFIRALAQPEVRGPLQTFVAAAIAPLRPGENMTGRLAHASMLMNMHRAMLQEAPLQERERLAQVQRAEAQARREAAGADVAERTMQDEIEYAKVRVRNAIKDGNLKEAERMLRELEMLSKQEALRWAPTLHQLELDKLRAEIAETRRRANMPYAVPRAPSNDTSDKHLQDALTLYNGAVKAYEAARKAGHVPPGYNIELWLTSPTNAYYNKAHEVLAAKALLEARGLLPKDAAQPDAPANGKAFRFDEMKGKIVPK